MIVVGVNHPTYAPTREIFVRTFRYYVSWPERYHDFIRDKAENVVTVPISALFRENEQWSVFKVVDDIAQLTKVEIGLRNDRIAQVTNGLIEGDLIIVHPGNDVGDGFKVTAR